MSSSLIEPSALFVTLPMRWKIGSIGCSALGWHASGTAPSASGAGKPREEDDDIRSAFNIEMSLQLMSTDRSTAECVGQVKKTITTKPKFYTLNFWMEDVAPGVPRSSAALPR